MKCKKKLNFDGNFTKLQDKQDYCIISSSNTETIKKETVWFKNGTNGIITVVLQKSSFQWIRLDDVNFLNWFLNKFATFLQ